MKKSLNILYVILFLSIALVPLLTINREENVISKIDNRNLVEAPVFGKKGFTDDFESYLRDRIGFRNQLVNGYAELNNLVAEELTHPIYTYGKNGYVFFNTEPNISYGDYHKTFAEMVLKMQKYCEERGTKFYFMFEPEKSSVLREYLPKGVNYDDSWVDSMIGYMDELGVNYTNNTELLCDKSENEVVFNKQFDAGHWNDLGCFYATNNLLSKMHLDFPKVTELKKDEFNISYSTETTLPVSEFRINEKVPDYKLKSKYTDLTEQYIDEVSISSQYPHFHYYVNEAKNASELPKTLIFQGSYYNRGPQFFVSRTSEDIGVHNYQNVMNLDYYFNIFQPEVVIFEVAEYTFLEQYFEANRMKNVSFNPALFDYSDKQKLDEYAQNLKDNSTLFQVDSSVKLYEGEAIDEVYVNRKYSDAKYAYMILQNQIVDLKKNDAGMYGASLSHNIIHSGDKVTIVIEDYDGKRYYSPMQVDLTEKCEGEITFSDNVSVRKKETYVLNTNVKGNMFDKVEVQLYNGETGEYMDSLSLTDETGTVCGLYYNNSPSGLYTLRFKANSNMQDEYVDYTLRLENNNLYNFEFQVNKLDEKEVKLSKIKVF